MKKTQVSIEFLLTMGLMLLTFLTLVAINESQKKDLRAYEIEEKLKGPCYYVSSLITNIYTMGDGSKVTDKLDCNFTVSGRDRVVIAWEKLPGINRTYFCNYMIENVTNGYNNSFMVPLNVNFTVENIDGNIQIREATLDHGLVMWLQMNGNDSNKLIDSTGNGNYGNMTNDVYCTGEGALGRGVGCVFDAGGGDYVDIRKDLVSSWKNFTISAWVKAADATPDENKYIALQWGAADTDTFRLYLTAVSGFIKLGITESTQPPATETEAQTANSLPDENWHHIVGVWDGSTIDIYIDGNSNVTTPPTHADVFVTGPSAKLTIGDTGTSSWDGNIDDVRIYNRSLTANEVKRLYDSYSSYITKYVDYFPR